LNRPSTFPAAPGLFHPGNAHGLSAFRALLRLKIGARLRAPSSLAVRRHQRCRIDFGGLIPSGSQHDTTEAAPPCMPSWRSLPSEALPLAAGAPVSPGASSPVLGAGHPGPKPEATSRCTTEFPLAASRFHERGRERPTRHRPLWGFPPLRSLQRRVPPSSGSEPPANERERRAGAVGADPPRRARTADAEHPEREEARDRGRALQPEPWPKPWSEPGQDTGACR
jgi:hypothetical protein